MGADMNKINYYDETKKTNMVSTVFTDGMVVTADDLHTAMRYPIELIQTLIRAYFGCGIVCGFEVNKYPEEAEKTFCVKIEPGVALDCHGYPLQLCESVKIDLTPDPCACEDPPECLCIAIRRDMVPEAPRQDSSDCDVNGKASCQYARERELVRIKVFKPEDLPKTLCARPGKWDCRTCEEDEQGNGNTGTLDTWENKQKVLGQCLKTCSDCNCCGEAWVLLTCVKLNECSVEKVVDSRRKYIKPIACLCPPPPTLEECPPENYPKTEQVEKAKTTSSRVMKKTAAKSTVKTKT